MLRLMGRLQISFTQVTILKEIIIVDVSMNDFKDNQNIFLSLSLCLMVFSLKTFSRSCRISEYPCIGMARSEAVLHV